MEKIDEKYSEIQESHQDFKQKNNKGELKILSFQDNKENSKMYQT